MAEMIIPFAVLAGLAHAAPQNGINLSGSLNLSGVVDAEAAAVASSSASAQAVVSPTPAIQPVPSAPTALVNPIASAVDDAAGLASNVPVVDSIVEAATSALAEASASVTLPAILDVLPTGDFLQIVVPTTVPLTSTALIESLAALPANAEVTDIVSSVLGGSVSVQTTLPDLPLDPTAIIGGLPEITAAPDVKNIVNQLKGGILAEIAGTIASALGQLASAAGPELPSAPSILPSQILDALEALPTSVAASSATTVGVSREKDTSEEDTEEAKEKRQLQGVGNLLNGLTGGSNPLSSLTGAGTVSSVTGLLGANGNPLGSVTGSLGGAGSPLGGLLGGLSGLTGGLSSITSLLGSGSNPLSALTGILSNLGGLAGVTGGLSGIPGLGAITSNLPLGSILGGVAGGASGSGLGSIVLGIVKSIPLPTAGLAPLVEGIKSAALAPLTTILQNTPFLGQIVQSLGILNTLAVLNIGKFGSLAQLTDLPAIQSAVLLLNTPDLATATYVLTNATGGAIPLGSLLANPTDLVQVVSSLQPLVQNLPATVSYILLSQLGATGIQAVAPAVDTSLVSGILNKLPITALLSGLGDGGVGGQLTGGLTGNLIGSITEGPTGGQIGALTGGLLPIQKE